MQRGFCCRRRRAALGQSVTGMQQLARQIVTLVRNTNRLTVEAIGTSTALTDGTSLQGRPSGAAAAAPPSCQGPARGCWPHRGLCRCSIDSLPAPGAPEPKFSRQRATLPVAASALSAVSEEAPAARCRAVDPCRRHRRWSRWRRPPMPPQLSWMRRSPRSSRWAVCRSRRGQANARATGQEPLLGGRAAVPDAAPCSTPRTLPTFQSTSNCVAPAVAGCEGPGPARQEPVRDRLRRLRKVVFNQAHDRALGAGGQGGPKGEPCARCRPASGPSNVWQWGEPAWLRWLPLVILRPRRHPCLPYLAVPSCPQ